MKEKNIKIFTDTDGLYTPNTPVVVCEKTLYKDTKSGNTLAQLKLQNVSGETVSSVKVRVTPLDWLLDPLGDAIVYEYVNLAVSSNQEFGAQEPFLFSHSATRFFGAEVCYVKFESGAEWIKESGDAHHAKTVLVADTYQKAVTFSKNKAGMQDGEGFEKALVAFKKLEKAKRKKKAKKIFAVLAVICLVAALAGYFVITSFENSTVATESITAAPTTTVAPITIDPPALTSHNHGSNAP